jgi:hypothetical protein
MARAKTIYEDFWFVAFQKGDGSISVRSLVNSEEHVLKGPYATSFVEDVEDSVAHQSCKDVFLQALRRGL